MSDSFKVGARSSRAILRLIFLTAALLFLPQVSVQAQSNDAAFAEAVAALNARSFSAKGAAVEKLAGLGDPRAIPVLEALGDGSLYTLKGEDTVVIAERQGRIYTASDPVTGQTLGEKSSGDLKKIVANNKLRGQIRGALGQLALTSSDPDLRLQAVENIIASPSEDSLATLKQAREREAEDNIRARIDIAIATMELEAADPAIRRAAVAQLADSTDPDIKSLLERRLLDSGETDPEIRAIVEKAVDDINDRLALFGLAEDLIFGISLGSVLLLAAIGLAITFGVMGVINMAHGEMIMLGAYTTFVVQEIFRSTMPPDAFGFYLLAAIPAAFVVAAAFGVLIERGCIRFLYGRPLETLLATWGVSLILQQLVRSLFGANNREVANPDWIAGAISIGGGVSVTVNRVYIVLFCIAVVAALAAFIRYSRFGLQMRAVTQNRSMASAMGIRTGQIDALTFALGSGIAGVAGVALSQISNVSPNLGQNFIVDSFMVVVFGGVGSLWGTIVGAFGLGIVNKFLEPVSGAILGKVVVLVIIILFIQKRPRGLFALKGRAAEA